MQILHALLRLVMLLVALLIAGLSKAEGGLAGHWVGDATVFNDSVVIEFDIVVGSEGGYSGSISQPEQGIHHIPLLNVMLVDHQVTLVAREDQPLTGTLSEDGMSIAGSLSIAGYQLPILIRRDGEARLPTLTPSAPVESQFAGAWHGQVSGAQFTLNIANNPDHTASAELISINEGGMIIPAASIRTEGARVMLDLAAITGSYEGTLNAESSTIEGTFTQGATRIPLAFGKTAE